MVVPLPKKLLPVSRFVKICPAILVASFILLILIKLIAIPEIRRENTENVPNLDSEPDRQQYIRKVNDFCVPTDYIRRIRESMGTAHLNPARHLVEELLQLVTFPANLCPSKNETERLAVIIVHSARNHTKERQVIRKTWGSVRKYKEWKVVTFFSMGQPEYCVNSTDHDISKRTLEESEIEDFLQEENKVHRDILIGNFVDTYRNLTYKHLMSYKYILEYCPEADFIIKTDDDMFVDLLSILDLRSQEISSGSPSDIFCHHFHDKPTRCQKCPNGKWYSTREEWPEDRYPQYCLGNDFTVSMKWLKRIYSVRNKGGFFWVDDVFVLGKLRKIAEETYNETIVERNIKRNVTDLGKAKRGYVKNNCERRDINFGLFVFLTRHWDEFTGNMECLWKRSVENVLTSGVDLINE